MRDVETQRHIAKRFDSSSLICRLREGRLYEAAGLISKRVKSIPLTFKEILDLEEKWVNAIERNANNRDLSVPLMYLR